MSHSIFLINKICFLKFLRFLDEIFGSSRNSGITRYQKCSRPHNFLREIASLLETHIIIPSAITVRSTAWVSIFARRRDFDHARDAPRRWRMIIAEVLSGNISGYLIDKQYPRVAKSWMSVRSHWQSRHDRA